MLQLHYHPPARAAEPPPYDLAKAFMGAWRSAVARGAIEAGGMVGAYVAEPHILVVVVHAMPVPAMDPEFLRLGPGPGRSAFTIRGDHVWRGIHELAQAEVTRAAPGRGMAAIILHPGAIETAKARLADLEAA